MTCFSLKTKSGLIYNLFIGRLDTMEEKERGVLEPEKGKFRCPKSGSDSHCRIVHTSFSASLNGKGIGRRFLCVQY